MDNPLSVLNNLTNSPPSFKSQASGAAEGIFEGGAYDSRFSTGAFNVGSAAGQTNNTLWIIVVIIAGLLIFKDKILSWI